MLYAQNDTIIVPQRNDTAIMPQRNDTAIMMQRNDTTHTVDSFGKHPNQTHTTDSQPKRAIYQGMAIKLDLGSAAVVLGASRGKIQHYELAMNWRLIDRLYPTLEGGYVGGTRIQGDTVHYKGQGGFFRVGLDLNPLRESAAQSPHALLIGLRLGTAIQQINQTNVNLPTAAYQGLQADCWGEIVAGCQVEIVKIKTKRPTTNDRAQPDRPMAFYMGWMGRIRFLFTKSIPADPVEALRVPAYIPGFGNRDNIGWGLSYHIGFKF